MRALWDRLLWRLDHWWFGCAGELTGRRSMGGQPEWRCRVCGRVYYGAP
jgi:hypothetical protein